MSRPMKSKSKPRGASWPKDDKAAERARKAARARWQGRATAPASAALRASAALDLAPADDLVDELMPAPLPPDAALDTYEGLVPPGLREDEQAAPRPARGQRGMAEVYSRDVVAFVDEYVRVSELGRPFRLLPHQRELLRGAFAFDALGRLRWSTLVWSEIKKSGKTTVAALVGLWWAFCVEAPNEVYVLANDLDQAQSRVFATMVALIRANPRLRTGATLQRDRILLANGTVVRALSGDYSGAAGSNHGLTLWDELWGYQSERALRLWEEMTPVSTRLNSVRFVSTYSGFENESDLLRGLYLQGVTADEHPEGRGERAHPVLPVAVNEAARLWVYWSHVPRMPWQTPEYYAEQRATLRPAQFLRLHENRWATSQTQYISEEMWLACQDLNRRPLLPGRVAELFVGVDVAVKHDSSAVVAVMRDVDGGARPVLALALHRIWTPTPEAPVDIELTVEAYLRELCRNFKVRRILVDPYQMQRSLQALRKDGLSVEEYPQTSANLTAMGQALYDLVRDRNFATYPAPDLRAHVLNAVVVDNGRAWRIAKEKAARKIDGAVALAMAAVGCLSMPVGFPSLSWAVNKSTAGPDRVAPGQVAAGEARLIHPSERGAAYTVDADERMGTARAAEWRAAWKGEAPEPAPEPLPEVAGFLVRETTDPLYAVFTCQLCGVGGEIRRASLRYEANAHARERHAPSAEGRTWPLDTYPNGGPVWPTKRT
jgi:phage terminase large subunit-like protein